MALETVLIYGISRVCMLRSSCLIMEGLNSARLSGYLLSFISIVGNSILIKPKI